MTKAIKGLLALIFAFIVIVAVFGILPQLGIGSPFAGLGNLENPLAGLMEGGKNAAANAALDATGLKSKAKAALENNRDKIAAATGMSDAEVDAYGQKVTLAVPASAQDYLPYLGYLG